MTDAATGKQSLPVADPWPAQARRVLAVLDGGVVHNDQPEGWVRIVNVGVVLHIRRARLEAIRAGATGPDTALV